jgi:multiple sugar transport system substrate-binding protein
MYKRKEKIPMKDRISACILTAVLCSSLLTACGSVQASDDKTHVSLIVKVPSLTLSTVSQPDGVTAQDFLIQAGQAFAAQYEAADVSFSVEMFDYVDESAAITDSFDTDDAADVLFEDYFNMTAYIHTGRVVPLDDIITDEIRDDIYDNAWESSSINGVTYMMPFLSRQNILIYNKQLMRDCGLSNYVQEDGAIQSWSADEWTTILDTLATELPSNVYPMMMYGKNNQGDTHILSMLHVFGSDIYDSDGSFDFESDAAVSALAWIQKGVAKGWFPPHAENLEITDNQELFNNNQLVFYVFNNANIPLYDDISDYGFVNFPGNVATSFVTGFEVFDNGDDAKVQAAKDFIQYLYETDTWMAYSAGSIPVSKSVTAAYEDQIFMLSEFADNAEHEIDFMNKNPNWQGSDTSVRSVFYPQIHKLLSGTITPEACAAALDADCNAALRIGWAQSTLHQ